MRALRFLGPSGPPSGPLLLHGPPELRRMCLDPRSHLADAFPALISNVNSCGTVLLPSNIRAFGPDLCVCGWLLLESANHSHQVQAPQGVLSTSGLRMWLGLPYSLPKDGPISDISHPFRFFPFILRLPFSTPGYTMSQQACGRTNPRVQSYIRRSSEPCARQRQLIQYIRVGGESDGVSLLNSTHIHAHEH